MNDRPIIHWQEAGMEHSAHWHAENDAPPPKRILIADDRITADEAFRLACGGTALLWKGDFQNARQLLQAMARRCDKKPNKNNTSDKKPAEKFHLFRQSQSQRARTLGMLLLPFNADHSIPLNRAPDVRIACNEAYATKNTVSAPYITSLRSLLGIISAHEWRKKGVTVSALNARIFPHYGVFAPVRSEYLDLLSATPLPTSLRPDAIAFDIGTGTGVIAALLARRGITHIVATDLNPSALACAQDNLTQLGFEQRVTIVATDLFPEGRAALIVCNPPWIPARPNSPLESAVYDPESRMLKGFLAGLTTHLETEGEGWLILSDLAEHLGLRSRAELLEWIANAGLVVQEKRDIKPQHPRTSDKSDPLHTARAAETTSLWRLTIKH